MNIHSKIKLRYGLVRLTPEGELVGAHYFEAEGDQMQIWDPFSSFCGRFQADPRIEYNITIEQAKELCALNMIQVPGAFA